MMVCGYDIINANLRKLISFFLQLSICDEAFEFENSCQNSTLTKIAKKMKKWDRNIKGNLPELLQPSIIRLLTQISCTYKPCFMLILTANHQNA